MDDAVPHERRSDRGESKGPPRAIWSYREDGEARVPEPIRISPVPWRCLNPDYAVGFSPIRTSTNSFPIGGNFNACLSPPFAARSVSCCSHAKVTPRLPYSTALLWIASDVDGPFFRLLVRQDSSGLLPSIDATPTALVAATAGRPIATIWYHGSASKARNLCLKHPRWNRCCQRTARPTALLCRMAGAGSAAAGRPAPVAWNRREAVQDCLGVPTTDPSAEDLHPLRRVDRIEKTPARLFRRSLRKPAASRSDPQDAIADPFIVSSP